MLESEQRREELARFLKARREKVHPSEFGITASPRRRASGLLREEVAQLAGISVTWYTWMEQARPTNPSLPVLSRLGTALRLSPTERSHLISLARPDLTPSVALCPAQEPPQSLLASLRGLAPHPVYVTDAHWNVIAWNEPAIRVFGDFAQLEPDLRNILDLLFLNPGWRSLFVDWSTVAKGAVAQYRAQTVRLQDSTECRMRIARLLEASPDFATWWTSQEVRTPAAWRKAVDHPDAGQLIFDYVALRADAERGEVQFIIYTPADDGVSPERYAKLISGTVMG